MRKRCPSWTASRKSLAAGGDDDAELDASAWFCKAFRAYLERPGVACVRYVVLQGAQYGMILRRLLSCTVGPCQKTDSPSAPRVYRAGAAEEAADRKAVARAGQLPSRGRDTAEEPPSGLFDPLIVAPTTGVNALNQASAAERLKVVIAHQSLSDM